jgi:cytochrome P450 family 135
MTALREPDAGGPQVAEEARRQRPLPPGPRMPAILQTAGFIFAGSRFLKACRRRYGDVVYMRTLFDDGFVMLFDPGLVKQVFQGAPARLHAGEANALLGPIVGERSVLLLDEDEHLRHRRLMLPAFHGEHMRSYADAIQESADLEIERWPVGAPFTLLETMQALTLRVIVRAVFGYAPGPESDELSRRLRAMIEPLARPRGLVIMAALSRLRGRPGPEGQFAARRRSVDELLFAEIARRRADPELAAREDVFSALLLARDDEGEGLSDAEVRDELITLLLAGHETTATALAWTFDLLLHTPAVLERALAEVGGDGHYLDAVAKESLRIRPVIPGIGRVVRGEPFAIGEYEVPIGMEINPSIRTMHASGDLYPDPAAFRPERFLVPDPPDTYTWLPFGGGTRRCLGASFALMEMRIVLERVLGRVGRAMVAVDARPDRVQLRAITQSPRNGVRVRLLREPARRPQRAETADS